MILNDFSYPVIQQKQLKNATGIDTSNFALKSNLASLKTEVDKLDNDNLIHFPVDFSKLM